MRTLYHDEHVLVTDTTFQVNGGSFEIARLHHVYVVRVGTSPARHRSWPAALSTVTAVGVAGHSLRSDAWPELVIPTAALFLAGALLVAKPSRRRATHELWAVCDDGHVCLYRSADREVFERIRRAVIRARERTGW